MSPNESKESTRPASPAPRRGLQLMVLVLVAMGLLAVYSNYEKARRDQIDTVTIAPAPSATPTVSPTP